ncbi:MAG: Demethylmenaquinone methyltransferase [Candidatus Accumulibacter appositus]|uniref:Demethylmenaquinone methyltransferase n=1 Tax=Candidatus Accumulibacter appositus TaxID=1454003 RepID=A0A011QGW7_9PROT|nr:class I SAM-dependent methyltransferase [Accumulibacter sp.]EXI78074.1 MAG: Demethylmenaquinone methyltransferase [Candidatus Accumulibacter appositus]HRF05971.1 class I SAM-dependent methyltransferase [Accumulibacter sp.]
MSLRHSYTLISPFYDLVVAAATRAARLQSLTFLPAEPAQVLLSGIGTGLDLPLLPAQHSYTGIDLTHAMLQRAVPRAAQLDFRCLQGDCQRLPFSDHSFDLAILHLILAVLPDPVACLRETARVLKPGGRALIFDKFLRPGQHAPLRRLANPLLRRVATRLDVVFEELLDATPQLQLISDQPALAAGWFRLIRLQRR